MFITSKVCYLCGIHLKHVRTIQTTDQLTAVYILPPGDVIGKGDGISK